MGQSSTNQATANSASSQTLSLSKGSLSSGPCVVPPAAPDARDWFAKEVQPHGPLLKSYLRGSFPAVRDVDDVVQESYLRIWKAKAIQPIQSAKAFLFKVARHLALDTIRKDGNSPLDSVGSLADSRVLDIAPDAAAALISKETLHHLADAIAALPERTRAIVILHKLKGLSQKEVSDRLGMPLRTVEKHCLRGLRQCEEHLRRHGIDGFFA